MRTSVLFSLVLVACGGATTRSDPTPGPAPTDAPVELATLQIEAYGGVHFRIAQHGGTVEVLSPQGGVRELAAGLGEATALLRVGGTLYVANRAGELRSISLSDGALGAVASGLGPVRDLTLDHVGYFVVSSAERGLLRVTPAGEVSELAAAPGGRLELDPVSYRLTVHGDDGEGRVHDYLALVGDDAQELAARANRPMHPFTIRGIELTSAEYWPNRGDNETDYPADVLWGFYPEQGVVFEGEAASASATPEAIACATESYDALRAWLESATDAQLARLADGAPRFYLWVNDYSTASDPFPHEVRPARFWFWRRNPAVEGRVPGYWKWETTLTQDGVCHVPQQQQIEQYLAEWDG